MQRLGCELATVLMGILSERLRRVERDSLTGRARQGFLVTLSGELGTGKSVLVRAIIHALGYQGRVKSPTYTLVESYEASPVSDLTICMAHLDLYRLSDSDELSYLGFDDILHQNDLVLIEWPEQGGELIPSSNLHIKMSYTTDGQRQVELTALS